jgi:acetolactate synthase-1/2/3 large subunit
VSGNMKTSDLIVKCLESEGIDRIYGIPGEENIDVLESLASSGIEFVLTRHEQAAAFMATVQARLTGEPRVCLSTLGPGATNLVTGVADAMLSFAPLIAITGQAGMDRTSPPSKQVLDLQALFRPITKESISIRDGNKAPVLMRRAFDIALQERPGPVHLELPEDIMRTEAKGRPLVRCDNELVRPDKKSLSQIIAMIEEARRPLVLAGHGIVRGGAGPALRDFVKRWNIPVIHTWYGAGIVPYDADQSLNTIGVRASDNARAVYERSDLILLAGYDMLEFQPQFWNIGVEKEVIYIGQSPIGHSEHLEPEVQVIGSLKHIFQTLADCAHLKQYWAEDIRDLVHSTMEEDLPESVGAQPQNAVRAIRGALDKGDIVVSDVGAHLIWLVKYYPVFRENTLVLDNGLISMGVGVPGAIGAKMQFPDRKVVAVCGDGGFMMTGLELATAKENGVNFTTVIFNDGGYGLIKLKMERSCGRATAVRFQNPDFVKLAESMGAEGHRVEGSKELGTVLEDCLRRDALAVIDLKIDYSENARLLT